MGTYARDGPAAPHHAVQIDIPSEPRPRLVGSSSPNAFQHPNAKPAWSTDAPVGFGGKLAQASRGRQGSTRSVTEALKAAKDIKPEWWRLDAMRAMEVDSTARGRIGVGIDVVGDLTERAGVP